MREERGLQREGGGDSGEKDREKETGGGEDLSVRKIARELTGKKKFGYWKKNCVGGKEGIDQRYR